MWLINSILLVIKLTLSKWLFKVMRGFGIILNNCNYYLLKIIYLMRSISYNF